jgi:hypothetical protein
MMHGWQKTVFILIFERKMMYSDRIPQGTFIHIHAKGWMNENGMKLWLGKVWSRHSVASGKSQPY